MKFTELDRDEEYEGLVHILGPPATGQGPGQTEYNWFLSPLELEKALNYADQLPAAPEFATRLEFQISYDFYLWDPDERAYLPFQGPDHYLRFEGTYDRLLGQSYLRLALYDGYVLDVFLSFPFASVGPAFTKYLDILNQHSPFRISASHWQHWHINKRRNGYVGRKFQPPVATCT